MGGIFPTHGARLRIERHNVILRQAHVHEITDLQGCHFESDILLVGPVETIAPYLLETVHIGWRDLLERCEV